VSDWPSSDDRPSGILKSRSRFGIEKFVAWTAAISIGAGAGVAGWTMLRGDDDDAEATPEDESTSEADEEATTTGDPTATPDLGGPRLDVGGPLRLDMPEPYWIDPSQAPSEVPGPDIEVPDWD
jgi:hypothetical protein